MLTSGREFSIEQLKINLVGGPLQSYNFLECKTFFFNTNQDKPSTPVHVPPMLFPVYRLLNTGPTWRIQWSFCGPRGLTYMVLSANTQPSHSPSALRGFVVPLTVTFLYPRSPKIHAYSAGSNHYPITVFDPWKKIEIISFLLLGAKTRTLQSGKTISLKPS